MEKKEDVVEESLDSGILSMAANSIVSSSSINSWTDADNYEITINPDPQDENRDYRETKPIPEWAKGDELYTSLFFQQPGLMCHVPTRIWPKKNIYYKLFETESGLCLNNFKLSDDPRKNLGSPLYHHQRKMKLTGSSRPSGSSNE